MPHLQILSLGGSPQYLDLLCELDHHWHVATRSRLAITEPWRIARSLPPSAHLVSLGEALGRVARNEYDAVVVHQVRDLVEIRKRSDSMPVALHVDPGLEGAFGIGADSARAVVVPDGAATVCVFDSAQARRAWSDADLFGRVVPPGLDVTRYGPASGDIAAVVTIAGFLVEMPAVGGYEALASITAGLPLTVLGFNPALGRTDPGPPRAERREALRTHCVYLNTAVGPYGNACSIAVLEAMASGTPIVSLADPASPVTDGVDGVVGADPAALRLRVLELLEDADLRSAMGSAGRRTVETRFPRERFVSGWQGVLESLVSARGRAHVDVRRISA